MNAGQSVGQQNAPQHLETESLPNQIHRSLEESIIAGELAPGVRLLPDDIAESYGVSRIPVREAISSLHEAGWVEMRPRYGVYVRSRTRAELAELFEARAGIESELARLAASRAESADLDSLARIVSRSASAAEASDANELSLAAIDFNAALRTASRNTVLTVVSLTLEKRARFYFSPIAQLLGAEWSRGQSRLLDLLVERDVEGSGRSARRHIVETGEAVSLLLPADAFSD